ncbi:outer membrane protein [Ochrobactrum phage vB_OspM_OC]|nr:outer membrane protein [Ochrobactrum phage vB_OspM_OC]
MKLGRSLLVAGILSLSINMAAHAADAIQLQTIDIVTEQIITPYTGVYTGVFSGVTNYGDTNANVGALVGYNFDERFAGELAYEYTVNNSHLLSTNFIAGYPLNGIKPYVLAGVGYKWNDNHSDYAVWNVGGGIKFNVTERLELDTRYRFVKPFDGGNDSEKDHRITVGVNYRW